MHGRVSLVERYRLQHHYCRARYGVDAGNDTPMIGYQFLLILRARSKPVSPIGDHFVHCLQYKILSVMVLIISVIAISSLSMSRKDTLKSRYAKIISPLLGKSCLSSKINGQ